MNLKLLRNALMDFLNHLVGISFILICINGLSLIVHVFLIWDTHLLNIFFDCLGLLFLLCFYLLFCNHY